MMLTRPLTSVTSLRQHHVSICAEAVRRAYLAGESAASTRASMSSETRPSPDHVNSMKHVLSAADKASRDHIAACVTVKAGKRWTSAEIDLLHALNAQKLTKKEIANKLGRSIPSLRRHLRTKQVETKSQLRLAPARQKMISWTTEGKLELEKLYKLKLSDTEIAQRLSAPRITVAVTLKRHNLGLVAWHCASTPWSSEDDDLLAEMHALGLSIEEMAAMLTPRRSPESLTTRRKWLRLKEPASARWFSTSLRCCYRPVAHNTNGSRPFSTTLSRGTISRDSDNEMAATVRTHIDSWSNGARGVYSPWTETEEQLLAARRAAQVPMKKIAKELNRSIASISSKCDRLGTQKKVPRAWTPEDCSQLRLLFEGGATDHEICKALQRGLDSVCSRRAKMGLHRATADPPWTASEEQELERLFKEGLTDQDISIRLSTPRTAIAIAIKRHKLGLVSRHNSNLTWTAEDDELLKHLSGLNMSLKAIGEHFMPVRTASSIWHRKNKFHLVKRHSTHRSVSPKRMRVLPFSEEQDRQLRKLVAEGHSPTAIADLMVPKRTLSSVSNRLWRLNLLKLSQTALTSRLND